MHDSEQEHSGITGCRVTYEYHTERNALPELQQAG